jgi:hypothetical protein
MSGGQKDFAIAWEIKDYLLAHAWDLGHERWFDTLNVGPGLSGKGFYGQFQERCWMLG